MCHNIGLELKGGQAVRKVTFLDVDGVLNNGTWAIKMFEKDIRACHDDLFYEPSLDQLRRIVDLGWWNYPDICVRLVTGAEKAIFTYANNAERLAAVPLEGNDVPAVLPACHRPLQHAYARCKKHPVPSIEVFAQLDPLLLRPSYSWTLRGQGVPKPD